MADEVTEERRTGRSVCYETADDGTCMECQITGLRGIVFRGETDAVALCRAVVAMKGDD